MSKNASNDHFSRKSTGRVHPSLVNNPTMNPTAQPNTQYHHKETIWRVIIDILSLGILLGTTLIAHYIAIPFTRGFFCSDVTIKYPYRSDTIPTYAAVILSIGVPIVGMWTTELCKFLYYKHYGKPRFLIQFDLFCGNKIMIIPFVRNLYILTIVFAYGYLATWVLLDTTKNFVGELRPHFLAVCQPTLDCSSISGSTQLNLYNSYLEFGVNFTCSNTDTNLVREARRSFFSGHTAPIFYGFGYFIMYLHVAWSWRHLGILAHLFQVGLAVLGCYVGYTRISDFHHHWHDVLTGAIVGSVIAFFTFKFILDWRQYSPRFLPYIAPSDDTNAIDVQDVELNHRRMHNGGFSPNNDLRPKPIYPHVRTEAY